MHFVTHQEDPFIWDSPIMLEKPSVLIIGASGGVSAAFLQRVAKDRSRIQRLVLVDREKDVLRNPSIPHRDLDYEFTQTTIDVKENGEGYVRLLTEKSIDIVVDLSVNETRAMLEATDACGACYVNTGIANLPGENFAEVVLDLFRRKGEEWNAAHVLCAGMNPGIVNMWVRNGIEQFGVPDQVLHFEYDTARPLHGWFPIITWSRETFLDEVVNDPAGHMEGRDKIRSFYPNPLKHRISMEEVLRPLMALNHYPRGFLLLHEENITIGQRYDIPSRFLFSIDNKSMDYLERVYDERGEIPLNTIALGDNRKVPLRGSVTIGVRLAYEDQYVYFYNTTSHENMSGCSGSCWQVAAGLQAVVTMLLTERLKKHLYFVEDLYATSCRHSVWGTLVMEQMIIARDPPGSRQKKGAK